MQAKWVVEAVDIAGDCRVRGSFCCVGSGGLLGLERGEKALGHRVVPAVAFPAHACHQAKRCQRSAEILAGVLASAVGVKQRARFRRTGGVGVQQRSLDEIIRHPIVEAVAEHLTRLQADHDRQVQPTFARGQVSDIADPRRRLSIDRELTIKQIRCDVAGMLAVGRVRLEPALANASQAFLAHQTCDAPGANLMRASAQRTQHPGEPVRASATLVNRA